jgi:hypothetical protein
LAPSVPPLEGGSEEATGPVPGAPALSAAADARRGDVLLLTDVKVVSDAWVVVHPAAPGGGPDVSRVLGRAFVQHGTSARVPVDLGAAPRGTLHVMLHEDTGEIGRFEFGGAGTPDPPLTARGRAVVQAITVE